MPRTEPYWREKYYKLKAYNQVLESEVIPLKTEVTQLKVMLMQKDVYISELLNLLHSTRKGGINFEARKAQVEAKETGSV